MSAFSVPGLQAHELAPDVHVYTGELPPEERLDAAAFERLWALHPAESPHVRVAGKVYPVPRWHQAYGHDYEFSGFVSHAAPVPPLLCPLLEWTRRAVDPRLNGLLVNWYDGGREHRIAPHKDSPVRRVAGCPIVTVSLGAPRTFQMILRKRRVSLRVGDGSVVIVPDATNRRFAHAVPHLADDRGRRISVTVRAFEE